MEFRAPQSEKEWQQYYDLRYEVLSKPSGYAKSSVYEEGDSKAFHMAAFDDGEIAGVGRLHYDDENMAKGYVRFMAVAEDRQGRGIGRQMLGELEEIAKSAGTKKVKLKARESATGFYEKCGYRIIDKCSETFFKTPHWNMEKDL